MQLVVKMNDRTYDITELITKISFSDKLNDGCSKLEFTYIYNELIIENGARLWFKYKGVNIFYGYVFKVSKDKGAEISITAYDQLRYAKAKDNKFLEGATLTSFVNMMCHYFNFTKGSISDTGYVLDNHLFDNNTWLDMAYWGISETLTNKNRWYVLRDEFNSIALRNTEDLTLNLILGDESMCYDYSIEKSIDDEFYNQIVLLAKNDNTAQFILSKDENSIKKYGLLQYYEVCNDTNVSKAKAKADVLLSLYNNEKKTLTLECLGDTRIRAGNSFYGQISDIKLNKKLLVRSVTHKYIPTHTMQIEVML